MRVFIDTSSLYALLDRTDENHLKAKREWNRILDEDYTLVASNYILVETLALLQSRIGMEAVRGFQEDVFPLLFVEFITPKIHRLGRLIRFAFFIQEAAEFRGLCKFRGHAGNRDPKGVCL